MDTRAQGLVCFGGPNGDDRYFVVSETALQRRLAAIVSADVVGYGRLMSADEEGTLARLRKLREAVIVPRVERHKGRIVKLMGDGILLEFPSVVEAVQCWVEIQREVAARNAEGDEDKVIDFRVGINLGDIIIEDQDIHGDGVNVAARLEALAEPGGILISRAARDQIRDRLDVLLDDMGEVEVKNIARPIRIFRVVLGPGAGATAAIGAAGSGRRPLPFVAAAVAVVLAIGAAATWWLYPRPAAEVAAVAPATTLPLPDKPSIAVLPFDNLSDDPEQEYFADGMAEDIITDLSKISGLFVIARNSSFQYKGKATDIRQIAADLGVRYVLEGSVRRVGNQVRVNAQLIDARTGGHIWAERYDGGLDDVFALQDELTENIVQALRISLTVGEQAERTMAETASAEAYDAFLRGWAHYRRNTPDDFAKAVPYFEEAIALDPGYSRAHAALALLYSTVTEKNWSTGTSVWSFALDITMAEGLKREQESLDAAMKNPVLLSHLVASRQSIRRGRHQRAIDEAQKAMSSDPNDPLAHEAMGRVLVYAGQPEKAAQHVRQAMRLDPRFSDHYLFWLGLAEFGMERYPAAAATLTRSARANPEDDRSLIVLAAALGHSNKVSEAKAAIEKANKIRSDRQKQVIDTEKVEAGIDVFLVGPYTLEDVDWWAFKVAADRERLRDGLRLAGMPEKGEGEQFSPLVVDGATTVNPMAAKALHDRGVAFVDVRPDTLWKNGHIPGAINLDLKTAFDEASLLAVVAKDKEVVFYCMGPRCLVSSMACAKAVSWGFEKVYYLREGYPGWKAAGHPITVP